MDNIAVMFDNAGFRYCFDKTDKSYYVCDADGKEELRSKDPLGVWNYYIQRVDTIVEEES